ncbi:MAG: glycosyltransferase family 4 protein [Bacteroidetes bacterium]|nr:glycosyltransferase family 4 protein [Bacteroidota bacterium]
MRIGFNAQILTDGRTGVTRFAKNVIELLPEIGKPHEFVIFGNPKDVIVKHSNAILIPTSDSINSSAKRILWEQTVLPRLIKKYNLDLMYYPDHTSPIYKIKPKVIISVHDVSTFAVPETVGFKRRLYKQTVIKRSAKLCDAIITGSEATKKEISKYLPGSASKVRVVPYGLEESFSQIKDKKILLSIKAKYNLSAPFILHVGTVEARKNIIRMIRAFAKGHKNYGFQHKLVLVGKPGYGYDKIQQTIIEEGVKDFVTITGHIDNEDLSGIYSLADVLIYPSLYEGFGFPPLEAMKCGCPVVASHVTSLPEVIGLAGVYVNPESDESILGALYRVISDRKLHGKLVQLGKERVLHFTWKNTVKGILEVITNI